MAFDWEDILGDDIPLQAAYDRALERSDRVEQNFPCYGDCSYSEKENRYDVEEPLCDSDCGSCRNCDTYEDDCNRCIECRRLQCGLEV